LVLTVLLLLSQFYSFRTCEIFLENQWNISKVSKTANVGHKLSYITLQVCMHFQLWLSTYLYWLYCGFFLGLVYCVVSMATTLHKDWTLFFIGANVSVNWMVIYISPRQKEMPRNTTNIASAITTDLQMRAGHCLM
jgi:hypothetical protein